MKIIVISGSFDPILSPRSFRTTELVKELSRRGHDIRLLLPYRDDGYNISADIVELGLGFFRRGSNVYANKKSFLLRIVNRIATQFFAYPDFSIVRNLRKELKKEQRNYDLLISIVAPHAINWALGLMYKKDNKLAKTWVADCGDPFMLAGNSKQYRPFWFKYLEKTWCKHCDYISVPHKGAIDGYYPEFKNKIRIIPQAMNFEDVRLDEYKPNEIPTFAYSGSVVPGVCDPRNLLKYLSNTNKEFKFLIYTQQPELYSSFTKLLGDRLVILPYKPRLDLIKELSKMDFLVNFRLNNTVQASSKIIDYSLTKRPILYISYKDMDTNLVDQFLSGDYTGRFVINNIDKFNIKNVAQQFLELTN